MNKSLLLSKKEQSQMMPTFDELMVLIALVSREPFDYTRWRMDNLGDDNVKTLSRKAMQYREVRMNARR